MKSLFKHISALSLLLCSIAMQPITARPSFSGFTFSTQETLSEHKNTILALGALALVGLGIYWWKSSAPAKQSPQSDIELGNANHEDETNVLPLPEPVSPLQLNNVDSNDGQSQDSESESPDELNDVNIDAEHVIDHAHAPVINKQKIEAYLAGPLHANCTTNAQDACVYIHRGHRVVQEILSGDLVMEKKPFDLEVTHADRHAHLNNIISACWYLYGIAATKDQAFDEGTFIVHDNGALYDYLLQYIKNANPDWQTRANHTGSAYPYGYGRHSTHIKDCQKAGFHHYGIDIRFGDSINYWEYWVPFDKQQKPMLPAAKKHILFGKIDENRTFIKIENDGLFRYDGFPMHAAGVFGSVARKIGLGSNDLSTYRKEHMPAEIQTEIKQLINQHKLDIPTPLRIGDIITAAQEHPVLTDLAARLRQRFDHVEGRLGNEVILTPGELATQLPYNFT